MSSSHTQVTGAPDSIRLLKLLPGFPGQAISCTTHNVNPADKPQYFALSCVCSPESPTSDILLNAKQFPIRETLWQFLKRIHSEDHSLTLWCDQLCIDHENEQEKIHQLQNIDTIYQAASETWIYLGTLTPPLSTTITLLSRFAKLYDQIALNLDILSKMSPGHWWRTHSPTLAPRTDIFISGLEFLLKTTSA